MEYYGHNDWRDYHLAHHGILGQKWGVRRFQAYGSGGYDRKGGKTGKVVGEAKQSRAERKAARRAAVAENYKAKEIAKLDKRIANANRKYDKKTAKYEAKYEAARDAGNQKKADRYIKKIAEVTEYNRAKEVGLATIEKSRVMNYTYDDVVKESQTVAQTIGRNAALSAMTMLGPSPVGVILVTNPNDIKTLNRTTGEERALNGLDARMAGWDKGTEVRENYDRRADERKQRQEKSMEAGGRILDEVDKRVEKLEKKGKYVDEENFGKIMEDVYKSNQKDARYMTSKDDEPTSRKVYEQGFSKKDKSSMMNDAKNNRYSIDFLEAIQNKKLVSSKDNGAVMKEYSKYLDNPRNYWENERHKLEDE